MIFHALANVANSVAFSVVAAQQSLALIIALASWLIVLILQRVYDKGEFPGNPHAESDRSVNSARSRIVTSPGESERYGH